MRIRKAVVFTLVSLLLLSIYHPAVEASIGIEASTAADSSVPAEASAVSGTSLPRFSDVPAGNWADSFILEARRIKLTEGRSNNLFGYGDTVNRSEFVKFLVSLMGWELIDPPGGSFTDNQNRNQWYYKYIETALAHEAILKDADQFRPDDYITREDMALMIVRGMGYDGLGKQLAVLGNPFPDVQGSPGYITIVKDLGIVTGKPGNLFDPGGNAKREEAVVMLMRMYEKMKQPLKELHAFYAVSSNAQRDFLGHLTSASFGWSRLMYDESTKQVVLETSSKNGNDFSIPEGFSSRVEQARKAGASAQIMVYASEDTKVPDPSGKLSMGLVEHILSNPEVRKQVVRDITSLAGSMQKYGEQASFDGVVIDFEAMRGAKLRRLFNTFLKEMKTELGDKKLYVAVHAKRRPGLGHYDGYDYRTIGNIADRVILMAHDYGAKILNDHDMETGYNNTPLAPIDEVYYALKAITDMETGVADRDKIWLQISFDSIQWQMKDGKVVNKTAIHPYYDAIKTRLAQDSTVILYSDTFKYPWATYRNVQDNLDNIIWYEDARSVGAKISLAKMFAVKGVSLWRLGNIPDYPDTGSKKIYLDVWQKILKFKQ